MIPRLAVRLAVAAAILCGVGHSAVQGTESWYDADHGWRAVGLDRVLETNDGGATWRKLPNPLDSKPATVLRTGVRAGLQTDSTTDKTLWTNDDGRHWAYAPEVGSPATGAGHFLFWARARTVYRVIPWPPPYRCTRLLKGERCGYRDARGTIRSAKLRSTPVGTVPEGVALPTVIPGGVVAATGVAHATDRPFALIARYTSLNRPPHVRTQELPHPLDRTLYACSAPLVEWPRIAIPACDFARGDQDLFGYWTSVDGGSMWTLTGISPRP
jgi:hypothetical protein